MVVLIDNNYESSSRPLTRRKEEADWSCVYLPKQTCLSTERLMGVCVWTIVFEEREEDDDER